MDRRRFLFGALAGGAVWSAMPLGALRASGLARIPAEFEPTRAVWLGNYPDDAEMLAANTRIAAALMPHVEVKLLAQDDAQLRKAREGMRAAGVDVARMAFLVHPDAPYFIRDYNVFAHDADGKLAAVDFRWNTYGLPGWCRDHLYPDDAAKAEQCAKYVDPKDGDVDRWMAAQVGAAMVESTLFMEGGAIEVNGQGVLLISEPLALQRNPGMDKAAIERALLALPGMRKVIWLAEGLADDPHMMATITGDYVGYGAGGHTDEFVRFADARTILLAWVPEGAAHPVDAINRERMVRNLAILEAATDQDGRPFDIVKLPMPTPVEREVVVLEKPERRTDWTADVFPKSEGRKVGDKLVHVAAASYLNYVVANNLVLLPGYTAHGTSAAHEEEVATIMRKAFPGREIAFIDVLRLNWSGGGIHCATCSQPA